MRYAQIREMDVSNGEGIGMSLFVQGCHFHCQGCFNKETWSFSGGREWTAEVEEKFLELASRPYIKRISFLGGEPLADENAEAVFNLIFKIRERYPEKKIWLYTGYTWERILTDVVLDGEWGGLEQHISTSYFRGMCLCAADVVVDGQFQIENQDINHMKIAWAGSTNQRIIDVKKSMASNQIVLYGGVHEDN